VALAQSAPTKDSLIARHLQARGGATALAAIRTLDTSGAMRPPVFNADLLSRKVIARAGSVRIEATLKCPL
jgi:hypothetical protein